jgi:hypothetical protein
MSNKTPTIEEDARKAVDVLAAYGRTHFNPEAYVSRGKCIGKGVVSAMNIDEVIPATIEMLEDLNCYLAAAAVAAIEIGQGYGKVHRDGCKLIIELPDHWG